MDLRVFCNKIPWAILGPKIPWDHSKISIQYSVYVKMDDTYIADTFRVTSQGTYMAQSVK